MTHADWRRRVRRATAPRAGLFWPIPITLSADKTAERSPPAATSRSSIPTAARSLATMTVTEKYTIDNAHECARGVPHHATRRIPGVKMVHGAGRGEPRRAGEGAVGRRLQGEVRRALHDARRDARGVRAPRLVARRRLPDAQPDAPLARVPRQGRDRGLRRRAGALAARRAEARRHPGRGAHAHDRGADREVLPCRAPWCRPAIRSTCATPGRARRCCTPSSARTTAART